jgi:hypothetical protein
MLCYLAGGVLMCIRTKACRCKPSSTSSTITSPQRLPSVHQCTAALSPGLFFGVQSSSTADWACRMRFVVSPCCRVSHNVQAVQLCTHVFDGMLAI